MNFIKEIIQKFSSLKDNKKIALVVISGFLAMILIFVSELDFNKKEKDDLDLNEKLSRGEYCEYLEEKVTEIIESIDGAGKANVMITLSETTEYVYATNEKLNDKTIEGEYVIIEKDNNDSGLLVKTIEPKIRGVAIVCEGGNNLSVQNQIYSAVSAVLDISTARISISKLSYLEE